jgi:hypothetical protein
MSLKNFCRLSICIVALFLLASRVASAAQVTEKVEPPVQFEGGMQYDISNVTDKFVLRLPVTVKQGVTDVTPRLVAISVGGLRDESLMKFFKVKMERVEGNDGSVRVLIVTVFTRCWEQGGRCLEEGAKGQEPKVGAVPLAQGTYEMLLDMQTTPAPAAPGLIKLTLKLAPAQLDLPATLPIRQERPLWWGEPDTTGSLLLTEKTGGKTRLTDIRIHQLGVTGGVDETTSAELKFDSPPAEIGSGGWAKALVSQSSAAFPLGKTTGKLMVVSPQLAQPLTVNFEVVSRISRWIIVAFIVGGLIFSYFVRVWSVKRIELNETRVKAAAAADTLKREMIARPDEVFVRKVTPAHEKLERITSRTTAKEIQALVDAAKVALDGAVQDFDRRRTEAQDLFDSLKRATEHDRQLPPQFTAPLAESRQAVEDAGRSIEGNNILAAKNALDAVAAGLGAKFSQLVSDWRMQTKSFLSALDGLAPLLPASVASGLTQDVGTVNAMLDAITVTGDSATLRDVDAMLDGLRAARLRVRELVARAQLLLKSSRVSITKAQSPVLSPPQPEKIAGLIESFDKFQTSLAIWAEQPEVGAEELPSALSDMKAVWRQALLAQIKDDQAAHKRVDDLFESGKFIDATEAAVLAFPRGDTILGDDGVGDTSRGFGIEALFGSLAVAGAQGAPGTTIFRTVRERRAAPQLETLRVLSSRELYFLRLGRFVVAAIIITYGGWLMFADKVGTPLDLFAIFVWAFGMNFGVDTVLDGQEIKKIVKTEKT